MRAIVMGILFFVVSGFGLLLLGPGGGFQEVKTFGESFAKYPNTQDLRTTRCTSHFVTKDDPSLVFDFYKANLKPVSSDWELTQDGPDIVSIHSDKLWKTVLSEKQLDGTYRVTVQLNGCCEGFRP